MSFGDRIAAAATAEFTRFGGLKETREPLKSRIGDYYRQVGAKYDGGNTDIAWSAAFVSKMAALAGAGDHFPYDIRHSEYVYRLILNHRRGIGVFRGWNAKGMSFRLGDILASNRQGSAPISFDYAAGHSEYSSHCDIVTEVVSPTEVVATGGNVGDGVARTRYHRVGGTWLNTRNARHQVFCLIRAIETPDEAEAEPSFTIMRLP
jgi:hypothetical protein